MEAISTIRPGLLVSVGTSIRGNVQYFKTTLEAEHAVGDGSQARWETERRVKDKAEQERADKARSAAANAIRRVCVPCGAGALLCLMADEPALDAGIEEARRIVAEFNRGAVFSQIRLNVYRGRVADNDVVAVKSIKDEMRSLLDDMAQGMANLDVKRIRDAADAARQVGRMLDANTSERVKTAIEVARKAAREIVKAGETGAAEIDNVAIKRITEARTAFLDLDDASEVEAPDYSQSRAVDFEPTPEIKAAPRASLQFDF